MSIDPMTSPTQRAGADVQLRELLAKATPTPWQSKDPYLWDEIVGNVDGPDDGQYHYTEVAQVFGRADAALVVAAVNALPGLLADYAALQARIAELEARNAASERDAVKWRAWMEAQKRIESELPEGYAIELYCSPGDWSISLYDPTGKDLEIVDFDSTEDFVSRAIERAKEHAAIDAHAQGQAGEEKDG